MSCHEAGEVWEFREISRELFYDSKNSVPA
jgi:hypothetical protein